MDTRFYVGPLGGMLALPDVAADVAAPVARIGGSSASLMGRQWRDTLGYRRTWAWQWQWLLPAQLPYVEALTHGMVRGPLRLIDPRRTNRLPENVASGGSTSRSTRGFGVTVGGLAYRDLRAISADPTTLPAHLMLRGCQEWLRTIGGSGTLYPAGPEWDGTWQLPLVPHDESLRLSVWVVGQPGVTVGLEWTEYDAAGQGQGYFSEAGGDTVELSATVWQQIAVNVDPDPAAVALSPRLTTPEGSPAGSVFTTAWQIEALDAETPPPGLLTVAPGYAPELSGGWRIGGGAPVVVADPHGGSYPRAGFHNTGLVLVETDS